MRYKGFAEKSMQHNGYIIVIENKDRTKTIKMEFTEHQCTEIECLTSEKFTVVSRNEEDILYALAQALQQINIYPESPEVKEIKAVKRHLEDFRKLVFKEN